MVKVKEEKERLKADVAELRTLSNKLQQDIGQVGNYDDDYGDEIGDDGDEIGDDDNDADNDVDGQEVNPEQQAPARYWSSKRIFLKAIRIRNRF